MDMITEKQFNYIKNKLGREIPDIEQLKKLTKKEASGIISRNIVNHAPFLQWYIWTYKDNIYANTTRIYPFFEVEKYKNGEIKVQPKIFVNKRLAEEFANQKLKQKAIWQLEHQLKIKSLVENWK